MSTVKLKKGDQVVMLRSCIEAVEVFGKLFTVSCDQYTVDEGIQTHDIVSLEGWRGYFNVRFLKKVNIHNILLKKSVYYVSPNDNREVVRWTDGELNIVEGYPFNALNISEFIDELIITEKMDYHTQCLFESRKITEIINEYIDKKYYIRAAADARNTYIQSE